MGEKLTIQERVKLVFMFAKDEATYGSVAEEFNRTHPEREKPLRHTTVIRIIKHFQDAITTECQRISTETLNRVKGSFIKRIDACINVESEQFEHLL